MKEDSIVALTAMYFYVFFVGLVGLFIMIYILLEFFKVTLII